MITLILLCVFSTLAVISWISLIRDSEKLAVPGPFPLPILGNGHMFIGNSVKFLRLVREFKEKYGGICRAYILSKRYILVSEVKYIEAITSNKDLNTKGLSYKFLIPWLGTGLLTASGQKWKSHRKFLTPAFHFNILQNYLPVFLKNKNVLINKLQKLADRKPIDLFPIMAPYALDNVTESIMGVCCNAQTDSQSEYVASVEQLSIIMSTRMRNPFTEIDAIFNLMPEKKIHDKAVKVIYEHSKKVIQARREELKNLNITELNYDCEHGIKNKYPFLDLLLLAELDGRKFDDESIREEVDTFMFAGHDTTTSALVFSVFCLSKHKDVREKVLEEQMSILGDDLERDPTYSELQQMKYLELVIKESLRLFPPVPLIEREVTKNVEIADIFVPKDTSIIINIIGVHRDPDVYEDPMDFRPERFQNSQHNPFSWLPFSAGSRNCIGQKFAMMELKVTLSALVRTFEILPADEEPVLTADLILGSQNGVHVLLTTRAKQ